MGNNVNVLVATISKNGSFVGTAIGTFFPQKIQQGMLWGWRAQNSLYEEMVFATSKHGESI